jgi:amidase
MMAVDHVVSREDVIWAFGPELDPVLEVEPGARVRFETNDCFSGQIRTEDDLVTEIDFERVNSATGPVAVRGAEPGDSLVVEVLEVNPIDWGVATLIPGYGQLIDKVSAPVTRVFKVEEEAARLLVDEWGFTLEDAFIFLSVACDAGIAQACKPAQHFGAIARFSIPKIEATPSPFSPSA